MNTRREQENMQSKLEKYALVTGLALQLTGLRGLGSSVTQSSVESSNGEEIRGQNQLFEV